MRCKGLQLSAVIDDNGGPLIRLFRLETMWKLLNKWKTRLVVRWREFWSGLNWFIIEVCRVVIVTLIKVEWNDCLNEWNNQHEKKKKKNKKKKKKKKWWNERKKGAELFIYGIRKGKWKMENGKWKFGKEMKEMENLKQLKSTRPAEWRWVPPSRLVLWGGNSNIRRCHLLAIFQKFWRKLSPEEGS